MRWIERLPAVRKRVGWGMLGVVVVSVTAWYLVVPEKRISFLLSKSLGDSDRV